MEKEIIARMSAEELQRIRKDLLQEMNELEKQLVEKEKQIKPLKDEFKEKINLLKALYDNDFIQKIDGFDVFVNEQGRGFVEFIQGKDRHPFYADSIFRNEYDRLVWCEHDKMFFEKWEDEEEWGEEYFSNE